jgi:hypothetical protein
MFDSPGDRGSVWQFIQAFASDWVTPVAAGDGWQGDVLTTAEERLGLTLPATLHEAYELFGRRPDLTSNHDVLLTPAEWYVDDREEALVFRRENQGAASWGILLADLEKPDPAVYVRPDLGEPERESWTGWLDRLSVAFAEIVLSESLYAPEHLCDYLDEVEDVDIALLQRDYTRLGLPEYPQEPGSRWFLGRDVLVREDQRETLMVRARTVEALNEVREQFPGDWLAE